MSSGQPSTVRLHAGDNVVVAVRDLIGDDVTSERGLRLLQPIPRGHKVAARPIATGESIVKLAHAIGRATETIAAGEHVHEHNVAFVPESGDVADANAVAVRPRPEGLAQHFQGFRRASGRVGTRNLLGVLTTVNCSATVARLVAREVERLGLLQQYPYVDGVVALTHGGGCGLDLEGESLRYLRRVLAGYARHPNFAGVVLLGLGCEVNQVDALLQHEDLVGDPRVQALEIQASGGTRATVEAAVAALTSFLPAANEARREQVAVAELAVALQCGGSDGFSALTANPALGVAADWIVAAGGTVVLSETPEIYGAEDLLLRRAVSPAVADKLTERVEWWREHAARHGHTLDANPTPGNRAGGLTTILEKSLGAVAKGGASPLVDVLGYAEPISTPGLLFMDSPGFDPAAVTGQIACGCNLVCFTTGRGSVSGFKPAPCVKLATNTQMYERLRDDMDLDCGTVLSGEPIEDAGRRVYDLLLEVASGRRTCSEELDFGESEFVPWQPGAVV